MTMRVTFHAPSRDPEQIVERCRDLGVDSVSIYCSAIPGYDETGVVALEPLRAYVGKLRDGGIAVPAALKWIGRKPDYLLDPAGHRREVDAMLETVRNLGEVGVKVLLHYDDPEAPQHPEDDERAWAGFIAIFRELVAEAERADVYLANHAIWMCLRDQIRDEVLNSGITSPDQYRGFHHPGWPGPFLLRSADDLIRLTSAVPSDHNGVCLCTGMHIMGGDMPRLVDAFRGKIYYAQFRDLAGRWPQAEEVPLGTGDVDFWTVARRLQANGYAGPVSPEHLGTPRSPEQDLEAEAIEFTKRVVSGTATA